MAATNDRKTTRRVGQVRLQQPFELQQWLVVEGDVVQLLGLDSCLGKGVLDGVGWKARIVLLASEPLFLRCGDDPPIDNQSGRRVMIEGGDTQYCGHRGNLSGYMAIRGSRKNKLPVWGDGGS